MSENENAVIPAFDQNINSWQCDHCGNDLYSGCHTCAVKQVSALTAENAALRSRVEELTEECQKLNLLHMRAYNEACDDLKATIELEKMNAYASGLAEGRNT